MQTSDSAANQPNKRAIEELKAILLTQERERIESLARELEKLRSDLDDKEKLLNRLDALTIELLARRVRHSSEEMAKVLAPAIGPAIRNQIAAAKEDIVDALYPVIGQAIRKAVAEAMKNLARAVNEKLDNALSFRLFRRRVEARLKGLSPDEAVLSEVLPFGIHEVFYIHKKSGLLLAHVSRQREESAVKEVISGMLTAIKSFAQDALGADGKTQDLNVIEYDDFQIYLENGRYAFLAVVISGVPPERFYEQIKELETRLHKMFAKHLREFDGDLTPFAPIPAELNELMRAFEPQSAKRQKAPVWLKVAVLLLFLGLLGAGIWYAWPSSSAPQAAPLPSFNYHRFIKQMQSYLPANLFADLHNMRFIADGDVLLMEGTVGNEDERMQLARAAARASGFPVIVNQLQVAPELLKALDKINGTHILFSKGSWKLNAVQKAQIDSIIPYLQIFKDQKIQVIGHSDSMGNEAFNRSISRKRAQSVARYLQSRGIDPNRIVVQAKGSSEPFVSNNSLQNRALNRRVCFEIMREVKGE